MVNEPTAAFAQWFSLTERPDPGSALLSLNSAGGPIGPKIADRILSSLIRSKIGVKSGIPGTQSLFERKGLCPEFSGHVPEFRLAFYRQFWVGLRYCPVRAPVLKYIPFRSIFKQCPRTLP